MKGLIALLREWFCGTWCMERNKKAWKIGYEVGYEDGRAGRDKRPPPPTKIYTWYGRG